MLDYDAHARLADATAELMRTCAIATAQTMTASACQGLALWSNMLRSPDQRPVTRPTGIGSANPLEVLWRFSPADWLAKGNVWPNSNWGASYAPGSAWPAYAAAWARSPCAWPTFSDWTSWSRAYWPAWHHQPLQARLLATSEALTQTALRVALPSTYASYRSAGGHAAAQVIMPGAEAVVAGLAATAAFTQTQALLGVWRTMLGA
jgi:hypothetical protein